MSLLYAMLLDWENEGGHKKDWALDGTATRRCFGKPKNT